MASRRLPMRGCLAPEFLSKRSASSVNPLNNQQQLDTAFSKLEEVGLQTSPRYLLHFGTFLFSPESTYKLQSNEFVMWGDRILGEKEESYNVGVYTNGDTESESVSFPLFLQNLYTKYRTTHEAKPFFFLILMDESVLVHSAHVVGCVYDPKINKIFICETSTNVQPRAERIFLRAIPIMCIRMLNYTNISNRERIANDRDYYKGSEGNLSCILWPKTLFPAATDLSVQRIYKFVYEDEVDEELPTGTAFLEDRECQDYSLILPYVLAKEGVFRSSYEIFPKPFFLFNWLGIQQKQGEDPAAMEAELERRNALAKEVYRRMDKPMLGQHVYLQRLLGLV